MTPEPDAPAQSEGDTATGWGQPADLVGVGRYPDTGRRPRSLNMKRSQVGDGSSYGSGSPWCRSRQGRVARPDPARLGHRTCVGGRSQWSSAPGSG